jgi:1,4-alpha-glucan branching enzyme
VAALAPHASWTSSATHAVLPLLATDAGLALQVRAGIAAHRARFGGWGGGFWLPECAHAPWVDGALAGAGVRAAVVDWTDVLGPGPQPPRRSREGVTLVPLDREAMELVWHPRGYPCQGPYRDSHRFTTHRHRAWAVDGAVYDERRAAARARADAEDFVARVAERVADGGLCVVPFDTELLGHFWHEGVDWLREVIAACDARGLTLRPLDELLDGAAAASPVPPDAPVTSWGDGRDLRTWSGPGARGLAWRQRAAELRTLATASAPARALRELLALQASDWAFLLTHATAGEYPAERADGHEAALAAALAGDGEPALRHLAPHL